MGCGNSLEWDSDDPWKHELPPNKAPEPASIPQEGHGATANKPIVKQDVRLATVSAPANVKADESPCTKKPDLGGGKDEESDLSMPPNRFQNLNKSFKGRRKENHVRITADEPAPTNQGCSLFPRARYMKTAMRKQKTLSRKLWKP